MIGGFCSLGLGLLGWLVWTHVRTRRYFDRPALARNRLFDPLLIGASALAAAAGLVLLWRAGPLLGALATAVLVLVAAYRLFIRSVPFQRWLLRRDYQALRRSHPDLPEEALLFRLVIGRHPGWGEELVEQMVLDYPTLDDIAVVLARMERGFRGFR